MTTPMTPPADAVARLTALADTIAWGSIGNVADASAKAWAEKFVTVSRSDLRTLLAAYADAARDRERLDWLDSEEQRVDRVLAISVKRNHDRSCGDWTNAAGPVRDTIDAARTGEAR